jgi:hypothetical protein
MPPFFLYRTVARPCLCASIVVNITRVHIHGIVVLKKWIWIGDIKKAVLRIRFGSHVDPDPAFYLIADPDPQSKTILDPCGSDPVQT